MISRTRQAADRLLFPVKKRKHKVGLAPGSVVFVGEARSTPVTFHVTTYGPDTHRLQRPESVDAAVDGFLNAGDGTVTWLDVTGVHEADKIQRLGERLGLTALTQEDIVNTGQRAKVETFDDSIFISSKMLYTGNHDGAGHVVAEQVSLVIRPEGVVSFQEVPGDILDPLRDRIASGRGRIRRAGPAYLAYAILDVIIDNYFVVLETQAERAETLEDLIMDDPDEKVQHDLNELRRDLVYVRRHAWPMREVLSHLERMTHPLWPEETLRPFVRDAYEHAVQVLDMVESLRELAGGLMDLYMTALSTRMNEVMKVLTIIGTIFIPLTFVAGIYGMNFENMPELSAPYAYPITMAAMGLIAALLVYYFRRKSWL
ncbi:magnesium/cobalt transporter CorA [Longibacter sp.]|uniref:magnesium/cobalt transporter CorA n=1 Tax=Longibacter sp. TaxID=2045415 RepID=UPI003EB74A68